MRQVRRAAIIHAPPEQVWAALNDIARTPEWVVGLKHAEVITPGPFGRGSIYIDVNQPGPFVQRTRWRVTEFEPFICQVHESESRIIPTTMTLGLSVAPGGTRLEFIVEYAFLPRLGALGRLLERAVMTRLIGNVIAQNLANLEARVARHPALRATGSHAAAHA